MITPRIRSIPSWHPLYSCKTLGLFCSWYPRYPFKYFDTPWIPQLFFLHAAHIPFYCSLYSALTLPSIPHLFSLDASQIPLSCFNYFPPIYRLKRVVIYCNTSMHNDITKWQLSNPEITEIACGSWRSGRRLGRPFTRSAEAAMLLEYCHRLSPCCLWEETIQNI